MMTARSRSRTITSWDGMRSNAMESLHLVARREEYLHEQDLLRHPRAGAKYVADACLLSPLRMQRAALSADMTIVVWLPGVSLGELDGVRGIG